MTKDIQNRPPLQTCFSCKHLQWSVLAYPRSNQDLFDYILNLSFQMSLFVFVVLIIFRLGWMLWQKWTTLASWPLNAVRTTSPWTAASLLSNWVTTAPLTIQKVEGHAPFIPSWSKTFQNCFRVWISSTSQPLDKTEYHLHLQKSLLPPPRNLKRQSVTPPKKKEHQIQQCREIAGLAFPTSSSRWL